MPETSLNQKSAFVTGSDRGIGKAIALGFAKAGARLALHGLAAPDEAESLVAEMRAAGAENARYFTGDLLRSEEVLNLAAQVTAWGPVDILVNNAGIQRTGAFADISDATWHEVLAINLTAPFQLMREVLPTMMARGFGRIVNIASVHGVVASANKAPYVAAKFGLVGMSRVAALECATIGNAESGGVTVNCICPGWVDTPILDPQIEERQRSLNVSRQEALVSMLSDKQPTRRMSAPNEIARLVLWLCAPEAHNVTGTAIPVDGGWTTQ